MSQLVPLYGFVQGDTMGVLVMAHDDMTLETVQELLSASVHVRVEMSGRWTLSAQGRQLEGSRTVAESGLRPLERIDLRRWEAG
jgi:hypothetical protein